MKKIKTSLIVVFILIAVCTLVVVTKPWQSNQSAGEVSSQTSSQKEFTSSELSSETSSQAESSSDSSESSVIEAESSAAEESSDKAESSAAEEVLTSAVLEDQPDEPDLNFETSGSSYDDIMINVLTCILTKDTATLSTYVGEQGLRLSPTGAATANDVVLSAAEVASFFDGGSQKYGNYPGSGSAITLSRSDYYDQYISPSNFNFALASVSYNDADDLAAANGLVSEAKTISYNYVPNPMEWQELILVYGSEGNGDVLCGIIYRDQTTD